jgi:hypothetical protein
VELYLVPWTVREISSMSAEIQQRVLAAVEEAVPNSLPAFLKACRDFGEVEPAQVDGGARAFYNTLVENYSEEWVLGIVDDLVQLLPNEHKRNAVLSLCNRVGGASARAAPGGGGAAASADQEPGTPPPPGASTGAAAGAAAAAPLMKKGPKLMRPGATMQLKSMDGDGGDGAGGQAKNEPKVSKKDERRNEAEHEQVGR